MPTLPGTPPDFDVFTEKQHPRHGTSRLRPRLLLLRKARPASAETLHLQLEGTTGQAGLLELRLRTHQLITGHDWPVEHGHRIRPSEGSNELPFLIDPGAWTVIVTSDADRLEAAEDPLSLMPDAQLWTGGTGRVDYRSVETHSVSPAEEFMAALDVVPDDVERIGADGNVTLLAYGEADHLGFTAADIIAGIPLGGTEGCAPWSPATGAKARAWSSRPRPRRIAVPTRSSP